MSIPRRPSRREFIRTTAAGAGALALAGSRVGLARASFADLPEPAQSGIDHVIVAMMENRSYDHYLGWVPGSDGPQAGLKCNLDETGVAHGTGSLVICTGFSGLRPSRS